MLAVHFVLSFLAGALISNAIPHLTAGLRGEPFPTPFTTPRGIAPSPPELNVVWGSANLFIGLLLFSHPVWLGFAIGFVVAGWFLAKNFGKVRANGFKP
ncbi:MAG TPA: hypothetical protein VEQ16_08305 [Acidocella sp.]|jgi:hypothetical protein|nr:hypothetical protein [Acidocella sp.]